MPCKDVTEVIEVKLDGQDRLADYHFAKRTCGQAVGVASLLIDQLRERPLAELLSINAEDFLAEFPCPDETEEFLSLKHLFAIQSALEVLTGKEPGGKEDAFTASQVQYDEDETLIKGLISIDLMTEKIKSCGGCGSCGVASDKAKLRPKAKQRTGAVTP